MLDLVCTGGAEGSAIDVWDGFDKPSRELSDRSALASLLDARTSMRARIEQLAADLVDETAGALGYYLRAADAKDRSGRCRMTLNDLMDTKGAIAALDADFWSRAMALTDVYDCMPEARRNEWQKNIEALTTPPFELDTVVPTFEALLSSRERFFAERVDGVFNALSRRHVTNRPEGFSSRMIIPGAWSGSHANYHACGYINDLRAVIARFMGRDAPRWNATNAVVSYAAQTPGKWISVDGGALRLRVYRGIGTAHLEIHPDMAWRLNAILASLHPAAIPSQFREPPKEKPKTAPVLMKRLLPFEVLDLLGRMGPAFERLDPKSRGWNVPRTLVFPYESSDRELRRQVEAVLAAIGGVPSMVRGETRWAFDFDQAPVVREVIASGHIPDHRSHQFYPTPREVAASVIELAQIEPTHSVLEPSAGLGGLADLIAGKPQCVEVSELHCQVLRAKGHRAVCADFLSWANACEARFDRVVMNPPFSQGRWKSHVEAAASLLAPKGRLVAVLPASARGKVLARGLRHAWGPVFANAFEGATVDVVLLTLDRS